MRKRSWKIRYLRCRNFQTHKKKKIRIDPKITTITGPSNVGKTALIRLIRWVLLNKPNKRVTTIGENRTVAELGLGSHKIRRTRGKGGNTYKLDGKTYKAFGSSVPEEIDNLAKIGEVNFQMQFDPPFWLTDSPGQVSKNLNKLINLEAIDKTLKVIGGRLRETKTLVSVISGRVKELEETRSNLGWVKEASQELERIENICSELAELKAQRGSLAVSISECAALHDRLKNATSARTEAQEVLRDVTQIIESRGRSIRLAELIKRTANAKASRNRKKSDLLKTKASLQEKMKGKCPLCRQRIR